MTLNFKNSMCHYHKLFMYCCCCCVLTIYNTYNKSLSRVDQSLKFKLQSTLIKLSNFGISQQLVSPIENSNPEKILPSENQPFCLSKPGVEITYVVWHIYVIMWCDTYHTTPHAHIGFDKLSHICDYVTHTCDTYMWHIYVSHICVTYMYHTT